VEKGKVEEGLLKLGKEANERGGVLKEKARDKRINKRAISEGKKKMATSEKKSRRRT